MIFRKRPSSLAPVLCGFMLLLGAEVAGAQIRTVLVSPVPGNPVASGTVLRNALAGISSPSSTNRWLVKIEPGIYDVGTTLLPMRSWVDIEGSGIGVTTIRGSAVHPDATIHGASNAELRLLTVEATGNAYPGAIAMANYNGASPRIYRVRFSATGGGSIVYGIRNQDSAPLIEECEITATATGPSSTTYGVVFRTGSGPLPAGRSSILRSKINVSGGTSQNNGIYMGGVQLITELRDSRVDAFGGSAARGIYAYPDSSWFGQETLQIRNSEINAWGGSSESYGIDIGGFNGVVSIILDIFGSKVWGQASPTTYGIRQSFSPMGIQGSAVTGYTHTVESSGNVSIGGTFLQGGPAIAVGWIGCMGVWDENAVFYAQGACP
jgi:hypothetical protein